MKKMKRNLLTRTLAIFVAIMMVQAGMFSMVFAVSGDGESGSDPAIEFDGGGNDPDQNNGDQNNGDQNSGDQNKKDDDLLSTAKASSSLFSGDLLDNNGITVINISPVTKGYNQLGKKYTYVNAQGNGKVEWLATGVKTVTKDSDGHGHLWTVIADENAVPGTIITIYIQTDGNHYIAYTLEINGPGEFKFPHDISLGRGYCYLVSQTPPEPEDPGLFVKIVKEVEGKVGTFTFEFSVGSDIIVTTNADGNGSEESDEYPLDELWNNGEFTIEELGNAPDGWTYSDAAYTFKLSNGTVTVDKAGDDAHFDFEADEFLYTVYFKNTFKSEPPADPSKIKIEKRTINENGTFKFDVKVVDSDTADSVSITTANNTGVKYIDLTTDLGLESLFTGAITVEEDQTPITGWTLDTKVYRFVYLEGDLVEIYVNDVLQVNADTQYPAIPEDGMGVAKFENSWAGTTPEYEGFTSTSTSITFDEIPVPLANIPDEQPVIIEDDLVPLADVPQTGVEGVALSLVMLATSILGFMVLLATRRKGEEF